MTGAEWPSDAIDEIRTAATPPDTAAIRATGFRLLLDTERPVTIGDLTAATGMPKERVAETLASIRARGRAEFGDQDRLVGVAGLTLTPGRHELTIAGTTRWTWCALDAVGILGALEATGSVRSADPQTGEPVEIRFVNGVPDAAAHLFILGGYTEGNVREDWCPQVNFFTSRDAAAQWVASRGLDGSIVAVEDIVDKASAIWKPVVDHSAPRTP